MVYETPVQLNKTFKRESKGCIQYRISPTLCPQKCLQSPPNGDS